MRQTIAIFVDAYRELNSKRLFWIVMGLSLLVVLAFAAIGINEKGLSILGWSFPAPFNTTIFPREMFYKLMFANLGVKFWLAWVSTILALIATAGIFPELLASGSIELTLSKPISRLRLFLTKYVSGLLFTTLQVGLFTVASFVTLGLRAEMWEPGLFWAVPIMVVFYSYLFSICVLVGILTRSTVAAILVTMLVWFAVIFGVHTAERSLLLFVERNRAQVERVEQGIAAAEARKAERDNEEPAKGLEAASRLFRPDLTQQIERRKTKLEELKDSGRTIRRWHFGFYAIKTALPKTGETLDLLERTLISQADLRELRDDDQTTMEIPENPDDVAVDMGEVTERVQGRIRSRSVAWVVGSSLVFEFVVLGIGAWIFSRRDF